MIQTQSTLPTYEQMQKWDDEKLINVHSLIFDKNVNPRLGDEPQEWIDDYMYELHLIYEQRFIQSTVILEKNR